MREFRCVMRTRGDCRFAKGFEVAGLFDCLEHFDDPGRLLAEARRVLSPKGYLLVTVPAVSSLQSRVDRLSRHRLRYSRAGLAGLLAANHFELLRVSYFMMTVFPITAVSPVLSKWCCRQKVECPHVKCRVRKSSARSVVNNETFDFRRP